MSDLNTSWHSYPSIYNLGHKNVLDIFNEDVLIEEKIDGSQFSFGLFADELRCRSKGATLNIDAPEKMFQKAVDVAKGLIDKLNNGWTYRCEYLQKPKHNALAYDRVPQNNLILFDINTGEEEYLSYEAKKQEAERLGFEIVPIMFYGKVNSPEEIKAFLEKESILGGQKVEGVVVKNYARFGLDKKALMGKYVSEAFKEVHSNEWKKSNPSGSDIIQELILQYRTPARWNKSVMHLKERGLIENKPKDIGLLMKECRIDILKECEAEMKEKLYAWAKDKILRGCVAGLPEWYKEQLLNNNFPQKEKING